MTIGAMSSPRKSFSGVGARTLDRHSPVPLWSQLLDDLRSRVASGELAGGFPTDQALMAQYDVSRQTVREAMRRMVSEGLVERQRGRGSRLREPELKQPLGSLYSLYQVIEAQGMRQTSQVLTLDERVDPVVAAQLDRGPATSLIFLERIRLAGDRPLALDQAWLPADIARPLLDADFSHTALYDELASRCHVTPEGGTEDIRPVVPTVTERGYLQLARGRAAFLIDRRTYARGRPLEVRRTVVRGDRYALVAKWEGGDASAATSPPVLHLVPLALGAERRA